MPGEMIPPAIIHIEADDSDFVKVVTKDAAILKKWASEVTKRRIGADSAPLDEALAKDEAKLKDFGSKTTETKLGADEGLLDAKLAQARTQLASFAKHVANARLGADAAPFWSKIQGLRATLSASPATLDVEADIKPAMAEIAKLRGAVALAESGTLSSRLPIPYGRNYSSINSALAALAQPKVPRAADTAASAAAALAASSGSDGGGGGGGFLAALGNFFTPRFGRFGRAAGTLGTMLELTGLSVGHAIFSTVGIAGSAAGAAAGAGVLGLGVAGTLGVGMLTDAAGLGQALGDIRNVNSDVNNLNQAVAIYGKNSLQAVAAQKQLNYQLSGFAKVARGPVRRAVSAIQQFKKVFDKLTGPAEAKGANLITKAIQTAQKFLPIIGKFASINMTKIQQGLAPLFKWLTASGKHGGMTIFTELEKLFTSHIPTAMNAFVQGLESLFKIIGYVAPKTGGFLAKLSSFFTKLNAEMNKPNSNAKTTINSLIADFHAWYNFIKAVVVDVYRLFHSDKAHTGRSIIQTLTGFLQELGKWESSLKGQASLGRLFRVHKAEIISILNLIPPLAKSFAALYGALAPGMVQGMTMVIKALVKVIDGVAWLISKTAKIPHLGSVVGDIAKVAGAAVGIGILVTKLAQLKGAVTGVSKVIGLVKGVKSEGLVGSLRKMFSGKTSELAANTAAIQENTDALLGKGGAGGAGAAEKMAKGGWAATAGKAMGIAFAAYVANSALQGLLSKLTHTTPASMKKVGSNNAIGKALGWLGHTLAHGASDVARTLTGSNPPSKGGATAASRPGEGPLSPAQINRVLAQARSEIKKNEVKKASELLNSKLGYSASQAHQFYLKSAGLGGFPIRTTNLLPSIPGTGGLGVGATFAHPSSTPAHFTVNQTFNVQGATDPKTTADRTAHVTKQQIYALATSFGIGAGSAGY